MQRNLCLVDAAGDVVYRSRNVVSPRSTGVRAAPHDVHPQMMALYPNYPNPFSTGTAFEFQIRVPEDVELTVHDLLGREVAVVVSGTYPAGRHRVDWQPTALRSGAYFARLRARNHTAHQKLVVLR